MTKSTSTSRFDGTVPDGLLPHIKSHIEEYGLPMTQYSDRLEVTYGEASVSFSVENLGFGVAIVAPDDTHLYQTREAVIYLLDHVVPQASADMKWTGDENVNITPPNFQLGSVLSVQRVSANFLRVVIKCENLVPFSSGGMHFSLLLPPENRPAVWPMLDDKKRTVWPTGDDTLHRAGYTFVDFDPVSSSFSFDIFEHAGGRTTNWAQSALPGNVVGIMGPGGGDFPVCDALLIAGDETALPAIRRILANAATHTTGRAIIEVGDAQDISPITTPSGVQVEWVVRQDKTTLWSKLSKIDQLPAGTFVWIATERGIVRKAKDFFLKKGATKTESYFSGYWAY
ncbi:NADPH-dependent ferric siderophore reductase [Yoonia maritima]|uniref:NADPH-dependent ferric siderophore reductase n=1 Tax=Yoonia maritima TaxID=1435347 RepID=A0A2T0VV38_9RHOB|nr:siderophore-interacting protein [Yoonia maritima]PRY75475.1 NADPH-dependent ferric siderophore reductase [Yoonia maritima]